MNTWDDHVKRYSDPQWTGCICCGKIDKSNLNNKWCTKCACNCRVWKEPRDTHPCCHPDFDSLPVEASEMVVYHSDYFKKGE